MRDSMVFYRSFFDAIRELSAEEFKKCACAILEYGLDGKIPETCGIEKSIYIMAKPQIDKNVQRYANGCKGGKPTGNQTKPTCNQTVTKAEPTSNQTKPKCKKAEPNDNVNDNDNDNVNDKYIKPLAQCDPDESTCAGKFLLNDGTEYKITENDVKTFQQLYPGIDVKQELRNIEAWCLSNPKNRKTRNGAKRFLNSWLSRSQNRARPEQKPAAKPNRFNNFQQRQYNYQSLEAQLLESG